LKNIERAKLEKKPESGSQYEPFFVEKLAFKQKYSVFVIGKENCGKLI